MAQIRVPYVRIDRAHTIVKEGEVILRLKTFWGYLEAGDLDDIRGVTFELLRIIPSSANLAIHEYEITIQGDDNRRRIVQNVIIQTLRKDAAGRRALVMLANRMLGDPTT